MVKSPIEMDIDDWELLPVPNDSHDFEFGLESGKDLLFSKETNFSPVATVDNHYFIIPSPGLQEVSLKEKNSRPVKDEEEEENSALAIFKKLNDDKFVDMNVESPKFTTKGTITPVIEPEPILFDDKREEFYEHDKYPAIEKEGMDEEQECANHDIKEQPCWEGFGVKAWKWKLVGGVRALCSLGVAAATIGIMVLAGHQQQKYEPHSRRLQFQIYTNETRIKQVVQQATRMNQTFTEVRGVPMTRAHVSFGGYYDGL